MFSPTSFSLSAFQLTNLISIPQQILNTVKSISSIAPPFPFVPLAIAAILLINVFLANSHTNSSTTYANRTAETGIELQTKPVMMEILSTTMVVLQFVFFNQDSTASTQIIPIKFSQNAIPVPRVAITA